MISTTRRHLYLAGFMGTGKTAVGPEVANRLGRPFIDLDQMIETLAHRRIAEIFRIDGEEHFRHLESHALRLAVIAPGSVIALGGGAPLLPANQRIIAATGYTILLTAAWAAIWQRVQGAIADRPMLREAAGADAEMAARRLLGVRQPAYETVAQAAVDTTGCSIAEVADAIVERYNFLTVAG